MTKKFNVKTPVFFRAVEGGTPDAFRIAIEFEDVALPPELNDAHLCICPRPGVTFERANEVAKILRDNFHEIHYHHPLQ